MEVLIGDRGNRAFANLIEEYMGPDARRHFEELLEDLKTVEHERGYEEGYKDGAHAAPAEDEVTWVDAETS